MLQSQLLISLISAVALLVPSNRSVAQVNIDDIDVPPEITEEDVQTYQLQTAINLASEGTYKPSLSARVIIPAGDMVDGRYKPRRYRLNKSIVVRGGVVLTSDGRGRRAVRLRWNNVVDNQALLHFVDGHGGGLENVAIAVGQLEPGHKGDGVIGLLLESQSSAVFEHFTVDMSGAGANAVGVKIGKAAKVRNTESTTVQHFNVSAPKPVVIASGDNLVLSHFDLFVMDNHTNDNLAAVFQNENGYVPPNVVIGPGSGQRGDHALAFVGKREKKHGTGDMLTIQNFRWEQGTPKGPAWWIDVFRFDPAEPKKRLHAIESVVFINCRNSLLGKSKEAYEAFKIPKVGVLSTEIIGGFHPGKYVAE